MYMLVAALLLSCFAYAQVSPDDKSDALDGKSEALWTVETNDGNVYVGKVVEWTENEVKLQTESLGIINIPKNQIVAIEQTDKKDSRRNTDGKTVRQISSDFYRHPNRYFLTPSAYAIPKGEWYYQNTMLFFNQINYGITDHITAGAGVIPFPLFSPLWLSVKGSIPISENSFSLGINALAGGVTYSGSFFGTVYGNMTIGPPSGNISAGIGYGFVGDQWSSLPTFVLAGTKRVGKKIHLMTENFIVVVDGSAFSLLSLGARAGFNRVAFDFGLYIPVLGYSGSFIIPLLSVAVPIN